MSQRPEILSRKIVHGGYLTVEKLQIRLIDEAVVFREIERHGNVAAVLPYDIQRRCALVVRQFRAAVYEVTQEEQLTEACAGMIENETEEQAARREAYEELGVSLTSLERVARVWSSPGVSTERQSLFIAPYVLNDRIGPGGGVTAEHEGITVIECALDALANEVDKGVIADAKLVTLILALRCKQPQLFA